MDGNYDGKIVIGAELDSKNLEKQLKEQEKLLRNYQKEAENLTKTKVKSETDIQEYENALQLLRQMQEEEIKTLESESAKKAALEGYNQTKHRYQYFDNQSEEEKFHHSEHIHQHNLEYLHKEICKFLASYA